MKMRYLFYSMISGIIFGLGSLIIKILETQAAIFYMIIFNPFFILTSICGIPAFLLSQIALKKEKGSHVTLIIAITVTIISIIGGIFLGEFINLYEGIGIVLMISSIVLLLGGK